MNIPFNTYKDTFHKLSKLPLGSVIAGGWLRDQLLRNKNGMGGNLDKLEPRMIAEPFINYSMFERLPDMEAPADRTFAAGWSGEISGTYWTGLCQLAFTLDDAELKAKIEKWVNGVLAHQEEDGYLGSYPKDTDRMADYNAWSANWCYRALLSYYEATGRKDVLDAVYRGLLWFCENWKDQKKDYASNTVIESMCIVYAYTGDGRLIEFCEDFVSWLEANSKWQNKISQYLSPDLPYNSMHAVAYGETVKYPLLISCVTGNERYREASLNGMRKALDRIVLNTGGPSSCTEFLSPKGATAEVEYCNFATFASSYSWASLATGDAAWGDEIERIIFNGAQGARKKDERAIAYFTSPNQLYANRESSIYAERADYGTYAPCYNVACCPTQSVRILPEFIRASVLTDRSGGLYFYMYAPMNIKMDGIEIEVKTLYPFRENISVSVKRGARDKVYFRIPAWCRDYRFTLNGSVTEPRTENGFAVLDGGLKAGDELEIFFRQDVKIEKIDDSDMARQYPMSVSRGPLVYSLYIPTHWSEYPGLPITPLPDGWAWYEAQRSKDGLRRPEEQKNAPWYQAVSETLSPDRIRITEKDSSYVWEDAPVELEIPLYYAPNAIVVHSPRMHETYGAPIPVEGEEKYFRMIPYGCTNLRITYIPRAKGK